MIDSDRIELLVTVIVRDLIRRIVAGGPMKFAYDKTSPLIQCYEELQRRGLLEFTITPGELDLREIMVNVVCDDGLEERLKGYKEMNDL